MDPQAIIEAIEKGFNAAGSKLDAQLAELNETAKLVLEPKPEDIKSKAEVEDEEKAKLEEAGVVSGLTGLEVWDIPVGQALVGGFTAVFASELIDGFLINQGDMLKGVVKLAGAGAAIKWGGRLLGSTGSKALAILLAYDGVRSLIPIDTWARRGATTVTGMIPKGGLGGFTQNVETAGVVEQASQVAGDYYAKAEGR